MMPDLIDLIQSIAAGAGISGQEQKTAAQIRRLAEPYADEVCTDAMGNVICHKRGQGKRILFSAHMDTVGFFALGFDEKGNVHVDFSGDVDRSSMWNRAVRFEHGACGIIRPVVAKAEKRIDSKRPAEIRREDFFVELGAESDRQAAALVSVGEGAVWEGATCRCGSDFIRSPHADDAAGCAALLRVMERLQHCRNDLFFAFTVCGESGSLGAGTAASAAECDYAFSVDAAPATDAPDGETDHYRMSLGGGAALALREAGYAVNPELYGRLAAMAAREGIAIQSKLSHDRTDAGTFVSARPGCAVMSVGIPLRYQHTPHETVSQKDVSAVCDLLCAFAQSEL